MQSKPMCLWLRSHNPPPPHSTVNQSQATFTGHLPRQESKYDISLVVEAWSWWNLIYGGSPPPPPPLLVLWLATYIASCKKAAILLGQILSYRQPTKRIKFYGIKMHGTCNCISTSIISKGFFWWKKRITGHKFAIVGDFFGLFHINTAKLFCKF